MEDHLEGEPDWRDSSGADFVEAVLAAQEDNSELVVGRAQKARRQMGPVLYLLSPSLLAAYMKGNIGVDVLSCFVGRRRSVQDAVSRRSRLRAIGPYKAIAPALENLSREALAEYAAGKLTPRGVEILAEMPLPRQRLVLSLADPVRSKSLALVARSVRALLKRDVTNLLDALECRDALGQRWAAMKANHDLEATK